MIKLLCSLEIRNVSGILQYDQTRIRDRVVHLLTVGDGSYREICESSGV